MCACANVKMFQHETEMNQMRVCVFGQLLNGLYRTKSVVKRKIEFFPSDIGMKLYSNCTHTYTHMDIGWNLSEYRISPHTSVLSTSMLK